MAKQVVQDILPPKEERSIRKIPLPEKKKIETQPSFSESSNNGGNGGRNNSNFSPKPQRPKRSLLWKIVIPVVLVIVIFFGLFAFGKAEVEITPRKVSYDIDETIKIGNEGEIPFEIKTVSKEVTREAQSTGETEVERRASGEIIIFNNHSSKSQPLIKNTRFETPEGLIYRINESITVPGTTEKDGKVIPGQLKVTVYADSPGKNYNIGLTDFTIPGFKGLPQYENFFARSATEMTGGFIGKVKTIGESSEGSIRKELEDELETALRNEITSQVPENYILVPLSVRTTTKSLPTEEKGDTVIIKEQGTLSGIILPRTDLRDFIVSKIVSEPENTNVTNLEVLSYEIKDQGNNREDLEVLSSSEMSIRGKALIVWNIPEEEIKASLAGKAKKELKDTLFQFNSIEKAEAIIKPFWKRSFPKNPEKIEISIMESD